MFERLRDVLRTALDAATPPGDLRDLARHARPRRALGLMARRTIVVDSNIWKVYPAGRVTVYGKDEFGLVFELGTGPERKRRFARYSPRGSQSTDAALAELTERQLLEFFRQSQPAWTSPEGGYGAL